ncbi:sodium-dependent glucose transporter 1-like isoform X1 [Tigriopus californicus]|uniref:sodium-dependent glucose transporter 1-like isoform X1 n=1 Tax=Tigriopus californicus TaxID=6832 RepID=UPI0027D9F142|nr:sodium-dependent glucose transporter 1-like isoform X1 [Tigriopus californicus]
MEVIMKGQLGKWSVQILLNAAMLGLGLATCLQGPSLLKLEELYNTDTETISYIFLANSISSVVGFFIWTALMERVPKYRLLFFAFTVLLSGLASALFPHGGTLPILIVIASWYGIHSTSIHCGINALCLEVWRGQNTAPHIHSLHLLFSVGGFIAPLVSKPFIGPNQSANQLTWLFLWGSLPCFVVGLFLLVYYFGPWNQFDSKTPRPVSTVPDDEETPKEAVAKPKGSRAIITLMCFFASCYVLLEFSLISFLPTVAVKLPLNLSTDEAANTFAIFFAAFTISRGLAILLGIKFKANHTVLFNLGMLAIGSIVLSSFGTSAKWVFQCGYGITGLGMGSMFGNVFVCLEQYVTVTHRVANIINLGAILICMASPPLVGHFIDSFPMILMYLQLLVAIALSAIFIAINRIGNGLAK